MEDHPAEQSHLEHWLGPSWESTLAAYGGGGIGTVLVILGRVFAISELTTIGLGLIGTSVIAIGALARTQRQHERDIETPKPPIPPA
jgi:hypothetical protein